MELLEGIVLNRSPQCGPVDSTPLCNGQEHAEQDYGWVIDGEGYTDLFQRYLVEKVTHVAYGVDSDAQPPDFALGQFVVGVVAGQGRMVEVGADAGLAVLQKEPVTLVGGLRGAEPRYLAARPEAAAVHVGIGAAGKGKLARTAEIPFQVYARGCLGSVDRFDVQPRKRFVFRLTGVGAIAHFPSSRIYGRGIVLVIYPTRTYLSMLFSAVRARYRSPWASTQEPWAERPGKRSSTFPSSSSTLIWGGLPSSGRSLV